MRLVPSFGQKADEPLLDVDWIKGRGMLGSPQNATRNGQERLTSPRFLGALAPLRSRYLGQKELEGYPNVPINTILVSFLFTYQLLSLQIPKA